MAGAGAEPNRLTGPQRDGGATAQIETAHERVRSTVGVRPERRSHSPTSTETSPRRPLTSMKQILQALQKVFSRRYTQAHLNELEDVPHTSRFRIVHVFKSQLEQFSYDDGRIWVQVHDALQQLHGRNALSATWQSRNQTMLDRKDDLFRFLEECESEHYFDFIELMFQIPAGREKLGAFYNVIESLNLALNLDGSPYRVTAAVFEKNNSSNHQRPTLSFGSPRVVSYPQVIKVEEDGSPC